MANSIDDLLIDGLSFKLKAGASYVNERKSVTYHPQGSNYYSVSGTRLIKLLITGDQWLDPSSFRIMFDLVNMDPDPVKTLRTLGGAHTFFKRMRVLCNGTIIEDIDSYSRVHEMFKVLSPTDVRYNEAGESFGNEWDFNNHNKMDLTLANMPGIISGQSQTALFFPLSGLLMQSKYIPLRYAPITIELELCNNATDPIISDFGEGIPFTEANTSLNWVIQNVQVKCDVCILDNSLDNSYAEHLLSGKSLPINYNTYISQIQSILSGENGQKDVRLSITRSLSRLKSVFLSLDKLKILTFGNVGRKIWNNFYSPMYYYAGGTQNAFNELGEFEAQIQIGSKLIPEYPIRSHSEAFYQLRKTMGGGKLNTLDIDSHEYRNYKFIIGIDCEKVSQHGFTGINTRAGDILNISFKNQDIVPANYAHSMHVLLHSDQILEIRDSGCTVFD